MSLDWRLSKIKDWAQLCWEPGPEFPDDAERKRLNPVTQTLIWASLPVGVNQITEKNFEKFFIRISAIENISGSFRNEMRMTKWSSAPSP